MCNWLKILNFKRMSFLKNQVAQDYDRMTSYANEHDNIASNHQHVFLASSSFTSKFTKQKQNIKTTTNNSDVP